MHGMEYLFTLSRGLLRHQSCLHGRLSTLLALLLQKAYSQHSLKRQGQYQDLHSTLLNSS